MSIKTRVLSMIAAALTLLVGVAAVPATPAFAATYVTGSVSCVTGNAVEGVFVNANSGGGGWATMSAPGGTSSAVSWHYTLPNNGSYYLAVGCGGSPGSWATTNYSNNYSGGSSGLICYDTTYEVPSYLWYRCA